MYKLFLLSSLWTFCLCDPRSPRVYNVLITSKKNLAPSQALPVYEPVLRTTSFGYAFPPLIYTHLHPFDDGPRYFSGVPVQPLPVQNQNPVPEQSQPDSSQNEYVRGGDSTQDILTVNTDQIGHRDSSSAGNHHQVGYDDPARNQNLPSNVVPLNQYVPIYGPQINYQQYLPKEEPRAALPNYQQNHQDPKQAVANFKRNPGIPDVPPPPLPVRSS